jgi:hypothetical protein
LTLELVSPFLANETSSSRQYQHKPNRDGLKSKDNKTKTATTLEDALKLYFKEEVRSNLI